MSATKLETNDLTSCESILLLVLREIALNSNENITSTASVHSALAACSNSQHRLLAANYDYDVMNNATNVTDAHDATTTTTPYDSKGAMLFIVVTILIYALSIMTMIVSTLGRSLQDDEVKLFLKGYAALDIRKCVKRKVRTHTKVTLKFQLIKRFLTFKIHVR